MAWPTVFNKTTTTTTTTKLYLLLFIWLCSLGCHSEERTNIDCDKFLRTVLYCVFHVQKYIGEKF